MQSGAVVPGAIVRTLIRWVRYGARISGVGSLTPRLHAGYPRWSDFKRGSNLKSEVKRAVIFPMIGSRGEMSRYTFETKDVLVALPLIGSAIALSWEIGSFIPIGFGPYGLFSLSEHLLFATQALPIGLLVAALIPVLIVCVNKPVRWRRPASPPKVRARTGIIIVATIFLFIAAFVAYMALDARSTAMMVFSMAVAALGITYGIYPPALILWPRQLFITVAAFALALAMAIGCDQMRGRLNFAIWVAKSDAGLLHMALESGSKEVELLRSGERGLLVYERASKQFIFLKWDSVKTLEWGRRPLIRVGVPIEP
jgi:hypothetical protein